jgi:Xaa-Pro aminopeptidase
MYVSFGAEFFAANRNRLRELFTGTAPIVLSANGLLQRGGDSTFGFAQDASFWYLTGLDDPDIVLVIDREKEYIILPERTASREAFDGSLAEDVISLRSGVQTIYAEKEGWEQLASRLKKVKHVATVAPLPAFIDQYGMYTNPARAALVQKLKTIKPELELLDLSMHISRMRMIKQPAEIKALKAAIAITAKAMKAAMSPAKLRSYEYEYQLEAELSRGFRRLGADGHAFEPIVAGGVRACTLHNTSNNGQLSADELVVVDVGAAVQHYAADITRTRSLRAPSRRQQAVHAAVLEVQAHAFSLLKPGTLLKEYEADVAHFMGEKLRELGLIKSISEETVRQYFPHATSHFLGLNVHDVGDYNRPLEPGMVLTVEPGIYIAREGIGVRIEDDVLITTKGIEILSHALPRTLA